MKNETIAAAITAHLAAHKAAQTETAARRSLDAAITAGRGEPAALERAIEAKNARLKADVVFKRLPAPRRSLAASIITAAERIGGSVAAACGAEYSGQTTYRVRWATATPPLAEAYTLTDKGEQYSGKCTYRKTDATHYVTLDPAGVSALVENETLRTTSARDGLHLIALYPDGAAVWAKSHGKTITSERGWIAGNARVCYHSTKSKAHAEAGFAKKLAALEKEDREAKASRKQSRRAHLIARLCHGLTATLADAKALGYCEPGICAFQAHFGIADTATLPELVRTGDPSAVRLALKLARNAPTA